MFCSIASEDDGQPPANLFDEMWHIVDKIDRLVENAPPPRHHHVALLFVPLMGDCVPLFEWSQVGR